MALLQYWRPCYALARSGKSGSERWLYISLHTQISVLQEILLEIRQTLAGSILPGTEARQGRMGQQLSCLKLTQLHHTKHMPTIHKTTTISPEFVETIFFFQFQLIAFIYPDLNLFLPIHFPLFFVLCPSRSHLVIRYHGFPYGFVIYRGRHLLNTLRMLLCTRHCTRCYRHCSVSRRKKDDEQLRAQSLCLTLCDPRDCSPPGSSVHGILQVSKMEWVAITFSRGYSQPRD